jgi:hypothetical protein
MRYIQASIIMVIAAFPISAFGQQVAFKTDDFTISFAADGKPASLQSTPGYSELLHTSDPGNGFILKNCAGQGIRLSTFFDGKELIARSETTAQEVVFSVKQTSHYLLFKIEHLKGIPTNSGLSLHFEMNADASMNVIEMDYMTSAKANGGRVEISWNYLWNRDRSNPLGGFALFRSTSDDQFDDILLHLWTAEDIAHPKIKGDWTYEAAKRYVADWQKMFIDQSQLMLEAENLQDLYAGVKYAELADIKQIYLFTNTWRGGFWPKDQGNWQLRKDVFPNGETDLRKYSDYLAGKGIHLMLHYLSGSIGFEDPCYIGTKPDERLAIWGRGRLAKDAGASDSTLYFKPDPGVELPYRAEGESFLPPAVGSWCGFSWMRVENEIIQVESFDKTDEPVWVLKNCRRGLFTTKSVPHLKGSYSAGLIDTYGINFLPDNDSTLLEEIAKGYAEFCNRSGVFNVLFDGFENNCYNGRWGGEKFATLVYKNLDHPVLTGSSAGRPPSSFFHYKLNAIKRIMRGHRYYGSYSAPLILESPSREATKLLDAHYELSQFAAVGATEFSLGKPEPMFGLTVQELQKYGLTDTLLETVRNWKMASLLMTENQRAIIKSSFVKTDGLLPDSSKDPSSYLVYWLDKTGINQFQMSPVQVLTRSKIDGKWTSWQEHGPIEPKQYIKPGDSIGVKNPFKSQPLHFIIRVLWTTDYNSSDNLILQPQVAQLNNPTDTKVEPSGAGIAMAYENRRASDLWETKNLPNWKLDAVRLSDHRTIGMWVKGDSSNSVLVFEIPGRDYVVPINFSGLQYVEIPNGEAAWATGYWGWRVGTHQSNYDAVTSFKIGFGHVPSQTKAVVVVNGIKALKEMPSELVNPEVHVGNGFARIVGSVKTGEYIDYNGGTTATIYDPNWNELKKFQVELHDYAMPAGEAEIVVTSANKDSKPWLETQFMTRGEPITIDRQESND